MSCWQTLQDYGLRSIGIGERLLPRSDFTLCEHFVLIGSGMIWNIYFGVLALITGFFLATALAVAKASPHKWVRKPAEWFIFLFRGSPLFIQFFFAYFFFLSLKSQYAFFSPFTAAWLGALIVLFLNTAAYSGEIFYGALRSGTTMLRLMLDAHPALICPGETDFIFEHLTGADTCDIEALEGDWIYRNFRSRHGAPTEFTPDGFLAHIGAGGQTGVLMLHRCLDQVLDLYPHMRFIHFQRIRNLCTWRVEGWSSLFLKVHHSKTFSTLKMKSQYLIFRVHLDI